MTPVDLHARMMKMAHDEMPQHIVNEDGQSCFNLYTYLEGLESRLIKVLYTDSPVGDFEIDAAELAQYLWACLALEHGCRPDSTTFLGKPILD